MIFIFENLPTVTQFLRSPPCFTLPTVLWPRVDSVILLHIRTTPRLCAVFAGAFLSLPRVLGILLVRLHFTGPHPLHCVSGIGSRLSILSVSLLCGRICNDEVSAYGFMNMSRHLPILLVPRNWRSTLPRVRYIFGA